MPEESLKQKTAKGLFWGLVNNGSMQLLNLLIGICLGRILGPEDYGMVGMLTVFTAALRQHWRIRRRYGTRIIMRCSGSPRC